ncbi:Ureidoglycolate lyase [Vibrio thalassae]|uniref:Ureidoglycolate lyase n=1 Tax=Vibrio thalassae TaxID=1243014 RepID=A0A240EG72_9VIBR|nr:fumarylacetoacetate hydrolase family protein [Vibrio thalassae]SNX47687.1 Ureidoglycolate lyase [Vibrio thalassae]
MRVSQKTPHHYELLSSRPFDSSATLKVIAASEATLLAPITHGSVYAVGLNFRSHAGNSGAAKPEIFFKSIDAIRLSGSLSFPDEANNVHFEGELVIVIGRTCRDTNKQTALDCVFGYLAGNDLTERTWQGQDLQWWRAKGATGFGPVSNFITTDVKINNQEIITRLNGEVMQQETLANMIHNVPMIVSYISKYLTLRPGDMIFAGTPGRTKALKSGDSVSVSIEGIGEVSNTIE